MSKLIFFPAILLAGMLMFSAEVPENWEEYSNSLNCPKPKKVLLDSMVRISNTDKMHFSWTPSPASSGVRFILQRQLGSGLWFTVTNQVVTENAIVVDISPALQDGKRIRVRTKSLCECEQPLPCVSQPEKYTARFLNGSATVEDVPLEADVPMGDLLEDIYAAVCDDDATCQFIHFEDLTSDESFYDAYPHLENSIYDRATLCECLQPPPMTGQKLLDCTTSDSFSNDVMFEKANEPQPDC